MPETPEVVIDTENLTPEDGAKRVLAYLEQGGYLKA
jgi:adenylylsulfate kinase-like enzyme